MTSLVARHDIREAFRMVTEDCTDAREPASATPRWRGIPDTRGSAGSRNGKMEQHHRGTIS